MTCCSNNPSSTTFPALRVLSLLVCMVVLHSKAVAQDFNYTATLDVTTWQELPSQTICNTGNAEWQFAYRIPIGFSFPFNGANYDSLTIETNGYLLFDTDRNQAFTAYFQFQDKIDSLGNHAVLGYATSGTAGNQILKIQYKNVGQYSDPGEYLSYQIWLYENGRIDMVTGPNSYQPDSLNPNLDTTQYIRTGLLNTNMTGTNRGYFIGQTQSGPAGQPLNDTTPAIPVFNSVPASGTRYSFIPVTN